MKQEILSIIISTIIFTIITTWGIITLIKPDTRTPEQIKYDRYRSCLDNVITIDAEICNNWK